MDFGIIRVRSPERFNVPEQERLYLEACEKDPSPRFLGMLLRNDWSLWEKDTMPLVKWFNERGITHADDISAIILRSIWRARGVDLDLEGQIKSHQDYWIGNIGKPAP
jgi:hypothetical protein